MSLKRLQRALPLAVMWLPFTPAPAHAAASQSVPSPSQPSAPCASDHAPVPIDNGQSVPSQLRVALTGAVSVGNGKRARKAHAPKKAKTGPTTSSNGAMPSTGQKAPAVVASSVMQMAEQLLLATINRDRGACGLAPLTLDSRQSRCSRQHSRHMAARGTISHDQFPADVCVPHTYVGENVGEDTQSASKAVLTLHSMMMKEGPCPRKPCTAASYEAHGHYLNLVNPTYKRIGIGIVVANGTTWLTEDFMS